MRLNLSNVDSWGRERRVDSGVKHVTFRFVKTITIRELRQRWPETEAALMMEDEILIMRDSKPVAKLIRFVQPETKCPPWNPEQHAARIKRIFGNKVFPSVDQQIAQARADRKL